jgi:hypothetical protein
MTREIILGAYRVVVPQGRGTTTYLYVVVPQWHNHIGAQPHTAYRYVVNGINMGNYLVVYQLCPAFNA